MTNSPNPRRAPGVIQVRFHRVPGAVLVEIHRGARSLVNCLLPATLDTTRTTDGPWETRLSEHRRPTSVGSPRERGLSSTPHAIRREPLAVWRTNLPTRQGQILWRFSLLSEPCDAFYRPRLGDILIQVCILIDGSHTDHQTRALKPRRAKTHPLPTSSYLPAGVAAAHCPAPTW